MTSCKNDIVVHIICEGEEYTITTYVNEYRSLMMLIFDKIYPEAFGECLGMGKCGTCMVEIITSPENISFYDRNEAATLSKSGITDKDIRLSCQILIDAQINGLKVKVL